MMLLFQELFTMDEVVWRETVQSLSLKAYSMKQDIVLMFTLDTT